MINFDGNTLKAGERLGGLGSRLVRNLGSNNQGLAVRNELLNALRNEFGGTIPASVLKAMKVNDTASGFSVSTVNGKQTVTAADRPLTMRRVQAILDAVTAERVNNTAKTQIKSACEKIKQMIEQQPELAADKQSSLVLRLQLRVNAFATTLVKTIRDLAQTPMTDFCKIRDDAFADFDEALETVGHGVGEIEKKTQEIKVITAFARKVLNEAIGKIARARFATATVKDALGSKVTFTGDGKIAAHMEDMLMMGAEEAFTSEAACDKYINSAIIKIVGDGNRGQSVILNGKAFPIWNEKDPERTKEKCQQQIRQMLEDAFRDPNTGKVDKQSMALMMMTMKQELLNVVPISYPYVENHNGVLPIDGVAFLGTNTVEDRRMATEIKTLAPGKWQVNISASDVNEGIVSLPQSEMVYKTELAEGSEPGLNTFGFNAQMTVTSGVIGKEGEPTLPTVKCEADKTSVFFNASKLETREHARATYQKLVHDIATGNSNETKTDKLRKNFNDRIAHQGAQKMDAAQFRQWVAKNEKGLVDVLIAKSDASAQQYQELESVFLRDNNGNGADVALPGARGYPAVHVFGGNGISGDTYFAEYYQNHEKNV